MAFVCPVWVPIRHETLIPRGCIYASHLANYGDEKVALEIGLPEDLAIFAHAVNHGDLSGRAGPDRAPDGGPGYDRVPMGPRRLWGGGIWPAFLTAAATPSRA